MTVGKISIKETKSTNQLLVCCLTFIISNNSPPFLSMHFLFLKVHLELAKQAFLLLPSGTQGFNNFAGEEEGASVSSSKRYHEFNCFFFFLFIRLPPLPLPLSAPHSFKSVIIISKLGLLLHC